MNPSFRPPFESIAFLAKVDSGRSIMNYHTNELVFSQGESADAIFYIKQGTVKVTVTSELGKEAVVAVLGEDEFLGETCLYGQKLRLAAASAMTDAVIMRIEKAAFIEVLQAEPIFSEFFITHLLARTIRVEADLVDQLFNSSERRLARALLLLAKFGKDTELRKERWSRLSEQIFRVDKWSLCRGYAAMRIGSALK